MENLEIKTAKEEFEINKALCLFKLIYSNLEMFDDVSGYVMYEVASMFGDKLLKEVDINNIDDNFDFISIIFKLTDNAINGDNKAKTIATSFMEIISLDDIPQNVKTYAAQEMLLKTA